jgi:hypothetical protein
MSLEVQRLSLLAKILSFPDAVLPSAYLSGVGWENVANGVEISPLATFLSSDPEFWKKMLDNSQS